MMTNEEAVKWLRAYPKMTDFTMPQIEEALDMAEKALMEQAQADRNEFYNWDAPIRHKADRKYISRTAIEYINAPIAPVIQGEEVHYEWVAFRKQIEQLPSVSIPPEHDGCENCVYQDNPQDAMPCRECKQNYIDKWKAKANKVGYWEVMYEPKNMVVCSKCGKCVYLYNNRGSAYCPHCGDYKGGELNG